MSCFTGKYPMPVPLELDKLSLEAPMWVRDAHDIDWEPVSPVGPPSTG